MIMQGKTIVITGATSGIGQVAALKLAAQGARLVLVARDQARGEATLSRIRTINGKTAHTIYYADLSSIADTKRVAAAIAAAEPYVDVLINNAGALFNRRRETAEGLELTFATNHMGYFVLTQGLNARLRAAGGGARIINTASDAHRGATLDFDDLQSKNGYSGFKVYGRSKLANILFTRQLARRLEGTGVTVNCLHPGFVATRFGDQSGGLVQYGVGFAKRLFAISEDKGAETIVYLASAPEVVKTSGLYYYKCRPATPSAAAQDDAAAERLWQESEKLAA